MYGTFCMFCKLNITSPCPVAELLDQSDIPCIQLSLYFKTTHGTKQKWFYIADGLKI